MQKRFFKNDFDIKENISNFASVKANKANIISTIVDFALLPVLHLANKANIISTIVDMGVKDLQATCQ